MRSHGGLAFCTGTARRDALLSLLCGGCLAAFVVTSFTVGRPESGFDPVLDGWLYNSTLALAALLLARRASRRSADQPGWVLLALAASVWTTGDILWSVLYSDPTVEAPIPSVADLAWLVFYVPAALAIAFFVRVHAGNARLGLWLDGLIGGLTVCGVASAFVLPPIIAASTGTALEVAVNLAYPAGDLLLLLLVVASTIILGRVSAWWLLLAAGIGGFAVGDSVYLYQVATDTYQGGLVDLSWIVALVTMSMLVWVKPPQRALQRPNGTIALPVMCSTVALVLVASYDFANTSSSSFYLGIAALACSVPRLLLAGRQARTLSAVHRQARTDELTGLANRRALNEALPRLLATSTTEAPLALLLIDLDGFKDVNDSRGHDVGDKLLVHLASRLALHLKPSDLIARLGGDEFAIIRPQLTSDTEPATLATQLNRLMAETVEIDEHRITVGGSIGIALAPHHASTPSALLRLADTAMYAAKRSQLGHVLFNHELDQQASLRSDLQDRLTEPLSPDEFVTYFQPVIDLHTGATVGAEALVRWAHPTHGLLQPAAFLPLLRDLGGINALTTVVLRSAVSAVAQWQQRHGVALAVAVNVDSIDLQTLRIVEDLESLLAVHRVPTNSIIIEVTEATVFSNLEAVTNTLRALRRRNIRIALDDFGTGYSSLSHLRDLPIDQLKPDRSFITELETDPIGEAIVRTVLQLARTLHLATVGEGVEDQTTADMLTNLGCQHAQGFHWSHPLTSDQFTEHLASRLAARQAAPARPSRTPAEDAATLAR